ncbi:hypothetical protein HMPREF0497_1810 [Lentilactobacillus buchneri ATCC 11577]|nr:hypothetical protein HMPREF0497_1810 [Lentilactobacillus buchneri ATCC 11577]
MARDYKWDYPFCTYHCKRIEQPLCHPIDFDVRATAGVVIEETFFCPLLSTQVHFGHMKNVIGRNSDRAVAEYFGFFKRDGLIND